MGLLDGKTALVTGAGRGIGRALALDLAAAGANVVVNDIGASLAGGDKDTSVAQAVVDEITQAGGQAVADGHSVSDWDEAQAMVAAAMEAFGDLDIVVNNAGIVRDKFFHAMDPADWYAAIDVHLHGTFHVSRAAAPYFRQAGKGAYVHFTSTAGLIGTMGQANYSAAKAGIVGLSKSIALDMKRFGIRSNCVAPFAWTRMLESMPTDTPERAARAEVLKTMEPGKVASLVTFLGSDAAHEVSGQVFAVRNNEVYLMGQSRPLRTLHRGDGWTPERLAEQMLPAFRPSFYPLEVSGDVFNWDPI